MAGVELGIIRAPGFGILQGDGEGNLSLSVARRSGQLPLPVQNRDADRTCPLRLHHNLNLGGIKGQGSDFHTIELDVRLIRRPQLHRPVDARAGVPPGVGLVGVAGDDLQGVFLVCTEFSRQVYIEVGVAVGSEGQLLPIEPHLGVVVYPLELQHGRLPCQGFIRGKYVCVKVVTPFIPPGVHTTGRGGRPGLKQGGIVGQGNGRS